MSTPETNTPEPRLSVRDISVTFKSRDRGKTPVPAVNQVSFDVLPGETLGLVGESGSGKSTTGRALLRLIPVDSGQMMWKGRDLLGISKREFTRERRHFQMVFQDPYSSMDPSMPISRIVGEPLEVHEKLKGRARDKRVEELLDLVHLSKHYVRRYPYEFSGGQRQRIAIARAIALNPELLICDEPVSALDVSTQNQVIVLLKELREEVGLSILFIAHDLAVVRNISHRIMVMYLGHILETGDASRIFSAPAHPYTQALLAAVPVARPSQRDTRQRVMLSGEITEDSLPSGCVFHPRCPYVMDVCREVKPSVTPVTGGGEVACHLQTSGPTLAGEPLSNLATPTINQSETTTNEGEFSWL